VGECIEKFALPATTIANQLWSVGCMITDKDIIKKILHLVPDHLEQVAISIETLLDLNNMSIEIPTRHLHAVEDSKKKTSVGTKEGHLLLTEEEWMSWLMVRDGEGSSSNQGRRDHGRDKCGG
jgi:hypothetical protein